MLERPLALIGVFCFRISWCHRNQTLITLHPAEYRPPRLWRGGTLDNTMDSTEVFPRLGDGQGFKRAIKILGFCFCLDKYLKIP